MNHAKDKSFDEDCSRNHSDRRRQPTPLISQYTFGGGRRKTIRRVTEKRSHLFVDLYSSRLMFIVVTVITLSSIDAYLTLLLIEKGKVVEANPFMASVLSYGVFPFIIVKFLITASALIVLCLFKNARIARIGLPLAVKIYLCVIIYEIYIFMM